MKSIGDKEFEDHIASQLEIIDTILIKKDVEISERPMEAAELFIKLCVLKVNDGPPKDYLLQPWFKYIIRPTIAWYKKKYGDKAIHHKKSIARGIAPFDGVLYELNIPLTISRPNGDLTELVFPKEVQPYEDLKSFVLAPPNFSDNAKGAKRFYNSVKACVNLTRSIKNNLRTATVSSQRAQELSTGIEPSLQKSVDDILSAELSRMLLSYWEIHLAIEKALKVLIIQNGKQLRKTHDLLGLWNSVSGSERNEVITKLLSRFPDKQKVIEYRYGNGPRVSRREVYRNYMKALTVIDRITKMFSRKVVFHNTSFFLGKLPWHLS